VAHHLLQIFCIFLLNPYSVLIEKTLQTEWLLDDGDMARVNMPDVDSITGVKMTAFAPITTGVSIV
jgi:hypothetical protein